MRHWIAPVTLAILVHLSIAVLVFLFSSHPSTRKSEQALAISSYLIVTTPKTESPEPVIPKPTINEIKTKSELTESMPDSNPRDKEPSDVSAKLTDQAVPSDVQESPEIKTAPNTTVSSVPDATARQATKLNVEQLKLATDSYIQSLKTPAPNQWREHQIQKQTKAPRIKRKEHTPKYLPKISGLKEIAVSADGSRLIKYGKGCFSIARDQFGDQLWTSAPCPNSADDTRRLLKQSLDKYRFNKTNNE